MQIIDIQMRVACTNPKRSNQYLARNTAPTPWHVRAWCARLSWERHRRGRGAAAVQDHLEWRGFEYERLDGGTAPADRAAAVARFSDPRAPPPDLSSLPITCQPRLTTAVGRGTLRTCRLRRAEVDADSVVWRTYPLIRMAIRDSYSMTPS